LLTILLCCEKSVGVTRATRRNATRKVTVDNDDNGRKTRRRNDDDDADDDDDDEHDDNEEDNDDNDENNADDNDEQSERYRCVCGEQDDDGLAVQCGQCNVWQHALSRLSQRERRAGFARL
jgi:hypothetical protein